MGKDRQIQLVSEDICCGVELEYEGVCYSDSEGKLCASPLYNPGDPLLSFKRDGSLRPNDANTEIVFRRPLSGNSIRRALAQTEFLVEALPYSISWRCGMHVHVDYRGSSAVDAVTTSVLVALMEDTFFAWDGTGRQENKFCSPLSYSVSAYLPPRKDPEFTKYATCNIFSMFDRGSLELRFAASTKDMGIVTDYVNIGMSTKQVARSFGSPTDLLESYLSMGSPSEWIEQHYHPLVSKRLAEAALRMGDRIHSSAMNAAAAFAAIEPTTLRQVV